jgi:hypothetical protein
LAGGQHSRNSLLEECPSWLANMSPCVQVGGGAGRDTSAMVVCARMSLELFLIERMECDPSQGFPVQLSATRTSVSPANNRGRNNA